MGHGVRDVEIKERGVVLKLTIRGKKYGINPSPADILQLSERFGLMLKVLKQEGEDGEPRNPNADEQAQIADLLLSYLSGEYETFFRSLPTEMQAGIVREMWRWYEALRMPSVYPTDPMPASSPSPTTQEPPSGKSSSGTPKPSPGLHEATAPAER